MKTRADTGETSLKGLLRRASVIMNVEGPKPGSLQGRRQQKLASTEPNRQEAFNVIESLKLKLTEQQDHVDNIHSHCDELESKCKNLVDQLYTSTEECDKYSVLYAECLQDKNQKLRTIALEVIVGFIISVSSARQSTLPYVPPIFVTMPRLFADFAGSPSVFVLSLGHAAYRASRRTFGEL